MTSILPSQRITVHYNYQGLDDDEVAAYVLHKIRTAGGSKDIISDSALSAIHGFAQGNPRLIDNIMSDALTIGEQRRQHQHGTKFKNKCPQK